jgi:CBS domain-containing protein
MKVKTFMKSDVKTCHRGTNLAEAASILWDQDCGVLPVVDDARKVVGMISDRDICMAIVTKKRLASDIAVGEVISGNAIYTCSPEDQIDNALRTMQEHKVRRLPVANEGGEVCGILSINDVILAADPKGNNGIKYEDAIKTLKAICEHHQANEADNRQTASARNV